MEIDPHGIVPAESDQNGPVLEDFDADPFNLGGATTQVDGLDAVHDVPVKVQAVLGRARMPVGQLLQLGTGTVVELDRRVGEPVDIFVNDRLIARGEVVLIDNALGVTLTEIVRQDA
ncbi:flagellar motor switch protein FliN [Sphingomonas sp.]|uniref:flagellar motor switch protein FliN n=1 Tax=Sphingomonas sp. TaxID=28214 RepID=UPI001B1159A5|nr:flagellar motor switch protein FliN [Sphingomonas sp.]MBO9713496.1 flagellar motor switch protein FliN [Sphingomonas sp.]